jgi:hypothetical protein
VDFEEPRVTEDRYHLVQTEAALKKSLACPYSVAFKLQKTTTSAQSSNGADAKIADRNKQ